MWWIQFLVRNISHVFWHNNLYSVLFVFIFQLLLVDKKYGEVDPVLTSCGTVIGSYQGTPTNKESLKVYFLVLQVCHYLMAGQVSIYTMFCPMLPKRLCNKLVIPQLYRQTNCNINALCRSQRQTESKTNCNINTLCRSQRQTDSKPTNINLSCQSQRQTDSKPTVILMRYVGHNAKQTPNQPYFSCVIGFFQTCINQIWLFSSGDWPSKSPSKRRDLVSNWGPPKSICKRRQRADRASERVTGPAHVSCDTLVTTPYQLSSD